MPRCVGEIAHNRNGAAAANEHRLAAQHVGKGFGGDPDRVIIRIHADGGPVGQDLHFGLNSGGRAVSDAFLIRGDYLKWILIGHQPDADLGGRFGGDHRLRAGRDESAHDAVDFERRPRPHAFEHRESRLAGELRGADLDS